jgi:hypothetical protein
MNQSFDAVSFMRKRREEIEQEDAGLSWEERSWKTIAALKGNPLWERLKDRRIPTGTPLCKAFHQDEVKKT